MVHIENWKKILILLVCLLGIAYSTPNLLGKDRREWLAQNMPSALPSKTINLGLDLQGGSYLLLQVDVDNVVHDRADSLVQGLRPELREQKIGYTRMAALPDGLRLTLLNKNDGDAVKKTLRQQDQNLDILVSDDGVLEARMNEVALREIADQTISQSIEIVRRRIDETGTKEPIIARQGADRILLQLPGVEDPQHVKELLGRTAQLSFHLVSDSGPGDAGAKMYPMAENPERKIPVDRRAMITGDMLVNAQTSFQDGMAVVAFKLNGVGARRFCDVTRENTGKPFAIVLDDKIISAPVIRDSICGGSGVISGGFTVQTASDLALLLRAGALPAPLHVVEERTVGPTLGSDSVKAGKKACAMALLFVVTLACSVYGLFGVFASVGLLMNMILIVAVMSLLQATLTLPGIAGIVLTIGLAVDANVLVFERIKEELREGRSVIGAIDVGYKRALTTITDSNLTALIAALILFSLGSGPIKGFAVTMCIGVVTSYFCSLGLTRMIVLSWLRWKKPKTIAA